MSVIDNLKFLIKCSIHIISQLIIKKGMSLKWYRNPNYWGTPKINKRERENRKRMNSLNMLLLIILSY